MALVAALLTPAAGLAQSTSTDTPQVAPPSPPRLASIFDVESRPAAYDMAVTILDFDSGAATGARMYAGGAFFTVVAGQLDVDESQADVEPVPRRGHHAIAVDIEENDPSMDLGGFAAVVEAAMGNDADVILVAQLLGGFTAPMVSKPVQMIVLVNAMIPRSGESPNDWWAFLP